MTLAMAISSTSVVVPGQDVVSCDLDGDAVLLDLETSRYFKLNPVGAHIWAALGSRATVDTLRRSVMENFHVEAGRCARDIDALLAALRAAGLVKIDDAAAA